MDSAKIVSYAYDLCDVYAFGYTPCLYINTYIDPYIL